MTGEPVRVAVVGAGIMGTNHVRVLGTLPQCELVAVVDPDGHKGRTLAAAAGVSYFPDVAPLAGRADAAVLASASETHAGTGCALLAAGLDVLVEKPIALTTADAERLIAAAGGAGRLLAVGHVERFNPAVLELRRIVDEPVHLEFTRVGPFSPRVSGDVVLDLMIHDLDLALAFAGASPVAVQATGRAVRTPELDLASALLRFENGVTATLTASRVGQTKIRSIEVTQRQNFVVADLVRQDVSIHRVDHVEFLAEGGSRYRQTGLLEIPFLENRGEPLALELRDFLESVSQRREPAVPGTAGLRALELALRVRDLAARGA